MPDDFHVHDVQFRTLTISGAPSPPPLLRGWKDTVHTGEWKGAGRRDGRGVEPGYVGEPLGQRRRRLEAGSRTESEEVEGVAPAGEAPVPGVEAEQGRVAAQDEPFAGQAS